jgi:uncharacterized DUF497 family protein
MLFEWDEAKRQSNLAKHGLDFADAQSIFDGRTCVTVNGRSESEPRQMTTAKLRGKLYTVVWTERAGVRRIISLRRASDAEERAYEAVLR